MQNTYKSPLKYIVPILLVTSLYGGIHQKVMVIGQHWMRNIQGVSMKLTHLITKELKELLLRTGSYHQCMHNVSSDFFWGCSPYNNISQLFAWAETKEGYDYWLNIHRAMQHETKTYSNSTNT